jgi:hypothetical protein
MQSPVMSIKINTNTVTASTAGELDLFADNDGLKTVDESGNIVSVFGTTNLSNTPGAAQVVVESSSGSDTTLAAATSSLAGVMSAADKAKLDGVQSGADVTDATNVTAAGALMDSEVVNLAAVKSFDPADYATAAQGSTADSALQSGDNVSDLTNDAAYVTSDPTGVTGADAITNMMSLTQAEYDAITPNASTFYVIV